MKNIHILPTDKPSRLYLHSNNELQLRTNIIRTSEDYLGSNQNIYITSNEESKEKRLRFIIDNREGMYGFIHQVSVVLDSKICPEIILTTDQDLIKDGVQAIDDEFLEWFVKNPSCEEVEVVKGFADSTSYGFNFLDYKIIIPKETYMFLPKEKPKQERMYSEEEVLQLLLRLQQTESYDNLYDWFEQFKKKYETFNTKEK